VHEDVFAAIVRLDKSVTLGRVEPFHYACRHVRFSNLENNRGILIRQRGTPKEKSASGDRRAWVSDNMRQNRDRRVVRTRRSPVALGVDP
jgi:hypothetical protein